MSRIRPTIFTKVLSGPSICRNTLPTFRARQWQLVHQSSRRTNLTAAVANATPPHRYVVRPPKEGGEPLHERREDRQLPDITPKRGYLLGIPIFILTMLISAGAIFNYQRTNSSVVTSTLYAVRVNPEAREMLGDEIQFKAYMPWISGTMNQLHGKIDISYSIKGTKSEGVVHFVSLREGGKAGYFRTREWELIMPDGRKVELLVDEGILNL